MQFLTRYSFPDAWQDQIAAPWPEKAEFQAFAADPYDKLILLWGLYIYIYIHTHVVYTYIYVGMALMLCGRGSQNGLPAGGLKMWV